MTRLLIFILFIPTLALGQKLTTTEKSGQANIYNDALKHYIANDPKDGKSIFDTLLILEDDLFTDSLQLKIQETKIVILDSAEFSNRLQNESSFIAHKLFPLGFDNGHFFINIVPFYVHKDKDEILMENAGTCTVSYMYDCNKKEFRFYRSAYKGI